MVEALVGFLAETPVWGLAKFTFFCAMEHMNVIYLSIEENSDLIKCNYYFHHNK
jgi:hypothetical protein